MKQAYEAVIAISQEEVHALIAQRRRLLPHSIDARYESSLAVIRLRTPKQHR